jgi:hypothetical protein
MLDWRWESLGDLLDALMPLIPFLKRHFNLGLMTTGHHAALSEIDATVLKSSHAFVQLDWLEAVLEMLRCTAVMTNRFMKWLESCACHEHIWTMPDTNWRQRQNIFEKETGMKQCPLKGCRGSCMASYGAREWLEKVLNGVSSCLTQLLAKCTDTQRTVIVAIQQELWESLREELTAKLEHWHHLPHCLLGLLGKDRAQAKAVCRNAISEWECCDRKKVHRVCHRFFSDQLVHSQMAQFANTDASIEAFPRLHNLLLEYALIPLVERAVEGEHAKIEKVSLDYKNAISIDVS